MTHSRATNPAQRSRRRAGISIYYMRGRRRMTDRRQGVLDEEPIGIVISRGSRAEPPPRVWAYVWGEVPEVNIPTIDVKAA